MNVLHVVYNSYPDVTGAAVRTRYLVAAQARLGVRPAVLSSPFQPPADPGRANGIEYCEQIPYYRCYNGLAPARFMAAGKPLWERVAKLPALPSFARRVREVARQERAEILHAHNLFFCGLAAEAAGRSLRLPVVYEIRSLIEEGIENPGRLLPAAYRLLDAITSRLASGVVVLCEGLRQELIRRGVPDHKITVAGNGVDVATHRPPLERDRELLHNLEFPADAFVLGYIGTLLPYEGLDLLLDAAKLLAERFPRVRVLLVGEGSAKPALQQQARRLGLENVVRFVGRLPHDELAPYYSQVDLFVLPRRPQPITDRVTPLKPLEIMAYSKPLLAGDCAGHRELVLDGVNGALFNDFHPAGLAWKIEELMADPEGQARLGEQARRWVSQHRSWESQCEPVVELYSRLLRRSPPVCSKVLLVAPAPRENPTGGVETGVDMILHSSLPMRHRIRLWDRSRRRQPPRYTAVRLAVRLVDFARFSCSVASQLPDIVHIKSSSGANFVESAIYAVISRALGRRVFLQLHSGDFWRWYHQRSGGEQRLLRWALRAPTEILVLSEYWRQLVARLVPGRPVRVVPNGVHIPEEVNHQHPGDEWLRVLTIGTLGSHKGHFDILAAATRLKGKPIRFILAGPDETSGRGEGEEVRRRAADLQLDGAVEFVGPVGPLQKWELLAQADVFLLPSRAEGMPNAVLEAMAAGLPLVVTPVGSLPEMTTEGLGARLIAVGDFEGLAEALLELHEDPARRRAMGEWNRARAEACFSFSLVERQLDALYRGVPYLN